MSAAPLPGHPAASDPRRQSRSHQPLRHLDGRIGDGDLGCDANQPPVPLVRKACHAWAAVSDGCLVGKGVEDMA